MPRKKTEANPSGSGKPILQDYGSEKAKMKNLITPTTTKLTGEPDGLEDMSNMFLENPDELSPRDRAMIQRMASCQLTAREVQSVLQIPQARWDASLEMQNEYNRGIEVGKATLRRMQWLTAQKNPIMQIFLGKQYLGQADKLESKKPEGEEEDARSGFADKLKNIIDITPERESPEELDGEGEGSRQVLLAHVGTRQSDVAEEIGMAGTGDDEETD